MSEKSDVIKVAVRNGITTLPEIRAKYNEFSEGGYVYDVLPQMLKNAGLDVRVTSGYRKAGQAGNAGNRSWHTRHGAVDIVPQGNTTFEDLEEALYRHPEISKYMMDNGYGILDESGRSADSKALMKKTGATGAHFHIGKDTAAVRNYTSRRSSMWDDNMRQVEDMISGNFPSYNPANPAAFLQPQVPQQPVQVVTETAEPLAEPEVVQTYDPQEALRQEKQENFNKFKLFLSMLGGENQNNDFLSTLSMLT